MKSLRKAEPQDFEGYYRLRCQPGNIAWTGYTAAPSREGLADWFGRQLKSDTRTIRLLMDDGAVVGYIYSDILPDGTVELGYGTDQDRRGQGLGRDIIRLFVEQMRAEGRMHVIAVVAENNVASQKCLAANGFVHGARHDVRDLPLLTGPTVFEKWELTL